MPTCNALSLVAGLAEGASVMASGPCSVTRPGNELSLQLTENIKTTGLRGALKRLYAGAYYTRWFAKGYPRLSVFCRAVVVIRFVHYGGRL